MSHELKSFKEIPQYAGKPVKIVAGRKAVPIYAAPRKETVVNSPDIQWKPVDATARHVVSKAQWYCQPPQEKASFMKPDFHEKPSIRSKKQLNEQGFVEELINAQDVAVPALSQHEGRVKDGVKSSETLVEKAQDVIATIDYLTTEIRGPWAEYQTFVKESLGEVREQRIALGSETRLLMTALGDVRKFFLDADYEKEINRLRDFIDLCERLKRLKESGFLDAISDTILHLGEK